MANINIRRDVTDPFYRYKMERLQSKIEGKGNGIKTVIVNLSSVAQSLSRPPAYVIKYFGFELGAQTNTNPSDDRWIINGAHDAGKLQDHLDGFISKFVLCKKCKNPETDVHIKDGRIHLDCKACGQRSEVDPRLKLSSFILKNQPKSGKKDKAEKRARRAKARENGAADQNGETKDGSQGSHSDNADDEDGENGVDAGSDEADTKDFDDADEINDDDWAIDTSEKAIKARANQLPDDLKQKLAFGNDDDEDGDGEANGNSAYDQLGSWIISQGEEKGGPAKVEDVDIYVKAKELGIEAKHKTLTVLAQTIFDEEIASEIEPRAPMLKKMITSERHEKALMGGLERFLGNTHPELIPQLPKVLLALYQEDLVSEDTLKSWGSKASKKYVDVATSKKVRKAAEPFLQWLETAESDEDSDDE